MSPSGGQEQRRGPFRSGGMMRCLKLSIEEGGEEAIKGGDLRETRRCYREQNEFVVLDRFLTQPVIDQLLREVDVLTPDVNRNYVPGHKKGGSVRSEERRVGKECRSRGSP